MNKNESRNLPIIRVLLLMMLLLCTGSAAELFAQTKIMPLGDSITGTPGCWRSILWNRLQDSGYTNIDFVGTQTGQTCTLPFDSDCEGHGGILAVDIANLNQLPPWLAATNPDIVMMHLGSNDMMNGPKTNAQILAAYSTMIDQMRANNPNMIILVAQIIPMYSPTSGCSTCYQQVIELNAAIPAWAAGLTTAQSPIVVVDQWTGFDTATDTIEGLHPNDAGNQKISDKWYPALINYLSGGTVTLEPTAMVTVAPDTPAPSDTPVVTDAPTTEPVTLAPTDAPTDTPAPTVTPAPTTVPTATPYGVTDAPTADPVTIAPTDAPVVTDGPATTDPVPTVIPTTPPGDCTCTCVNLCSSTTAITIPFTFDDAGEFCWTASSLGTYVNSWNADAVNINGTSCTNTYVSSSSIPAICGVYYIYYKSSYSWSHIEIK